MSLLYCVHLIWLVLVSRCNHTSTLKNYTTHRPVVITCMRCSSLYLQLIVFLCATMTFVALVFFFLFCSPDLPVIGQKV